MEIKFLILSFITNLFLSVLKIIIGIYSNSKTLLADGMHSFSDLLTDVVAIVGIKISKIPADKSHPYGHGKYEYVTSIIISIIIIIMAITIGYNSIFTTSTIPSMISAVVLIFVIIIKFLISQLLINKSKKYNSNILYASGIESKYDVFSSLFALVFILASKLETYIPLFKYSDLIGGIIISILIFRIGFILLIKNLNTIIGEADYNKDKTSQINYILKDINDIISVEKITLLKYGRYYVLNIELVVNKNKTLEQIHKLEKEIRYKLKKTDYIKYVNIKFIPA